MDLLKDSDFRLTGVLVKVTKDRSVLGKILAMMGIMTIYATNYTCVAGS